MRTRSLIATLSWALFVSVIGAVSITSIATGLLERVGPIVCPEGSTVEVDEHHSSDGQGESMTSVSLTCQRPEAFWVRTMSGQGLVAAALLLPSLILVFVVRLGVARLPSSSSGGETSWWFMGAISLALALAAVGYEQYWKSPLDDPHLMLVGANAAHAMERIESVEGEGITVDQVMLRRRSFSVTRRFAKERGASQRIELVRGEMRVQPKRKRARRRIKPFALAAFDWKRVPPMVATAVEAAKHPGLRVQAFSVQRKGADGFRVHVAMRSETHQARVTLDEKGKVLTAKTALRSH